MSNVWTLLITDDCQEDREIYREYLSGDPDQIYQFIEAGSAEVGLALCQNQHCDAILLDFCLPDMTGLEFLDELHQQAKLTLPVIMLTGQGDERVAVQAIKRGAQDYLVKQNLEPDHLQVTVRNVLRQSQRPTSLPSQRDYQHFLAEAALHLHRSLDMEEILETAVTEIHSVLKCDRVVVYQLEALSSQGCNGSLGAPTLTKRWETGLSGQTRDPLSKFISFLMVGCESQASTRRPSQLPEMDAAPILITGNPEPETYLLAPIVAVPSSDERDPVALPEASVWGVLVAYQASQRQWQSDEVQFLNGLAQQLAIAIQQSDQLTQALAALETEKQLNALKSQLVATVSHEYRSPLAAILAAASTLKLHEAHLSPPQQQSFLSLIETKARQMAQLVDDLLVLETFEAGKVNFTPLPFELLQCISDLIDDQQQAVGDRYQLTFRIVGNTKGFLGDQKLLRLILTNLLSNAIKYSTEGSAIDVHLIGDETQIKIEVRDEGMGIPPEDQGHVFRPFCRGSNVGTIGGTGLGLAIVQACVDLHGGQVTVTSQVNQGTQFSVCLPKRSSLDFILN